MQVNEPYGVLVYNAGGKVIGSIRGLRFFRGGAPVAEFLVAPEAVEEIVEAMRSC